MLTVTAPGVYRTYVFVWVAIFRDYGGYYLLMYVYIYIYINVFPEKYGYIELFDKLVVETWKRYIVRSLLRVAKHYITITIHHLLEYVAIPSLRNGML